jgi:hypothetical protein
MLAMLTGVNMAKTDPKIEISERALFQRVQRRLGSSGDTLKVPRGERMRRELGPYYVVNSRSTITDSRINLESYARKLGALQPWEALER